MSNDNNFKKIIYCCASQLLCAQTEVMLGWQEDALSDVTLRCPSCTSLRLLLCCTCTRLHDVYNKLHHFLVHNGPTPNFTLTSSCLCLISVAAMTVYNKLHHFLVWNGPASKWNSLHRFKTHYATQPVFTLRYVWLIGISHDLQNS